jgi:hypothetical protein
MYVTALAMCLALSQGQSELGKIDVIITIGFVLVTVFLINRLGMSGHFHGIASPILVDID